MAMPMSLFRPAAGTCLTEGAAADIARIQAIWAGTRVQYGASGPYLFGASFTIADAMYAPVVCRLLTYRPPLTQAAQAYCDAIRTHLLIDQWYADAASEPTAWHLEKYESAP